MKLRRTEGRNAAELKFYTTDDLRQLYQAGDEPVRLRDGIIDRTQLAAEIRWRGWREWLGYFVLLAVSVTSMVAALAGAVLAFVAWRFPVAPLK
jgi:hypothetical protein